MNTCPPGGSVGTKLHQVQEANPAPIPQIQVVPVFNLRLFMEMTVETSGEPVTTTDDIFLFCLSYHLKGVCRSNCGENHAHRRLYSR